MSSVPDWQRRAGGDAALAVRGCSGTLMLPVHASATSDKPIDELLAAPSISAPTSVYRLPR